MQPTVGHAASSTAVRGTVIGPWDRVVRFRTVVPTVPLGSREPGRSAMDSSGRPSSLERVHVASRLYRRFCRLPSVLQGLLWGVLFLTLLSSGWALWNGGTSGQPGASDGKGSPSVYDHGYSITKTVLANNQITLQIPGFGSETVQDTLLKNCRGIVQRIMAGGKAPTGFYSSPEEWYHGCTDYLAEWFAKRDQ